MCLFGFYSAGGPNYVTVARSIEGLCFFVGRVPVQGYVPCTRAPPMKKTPTALKWRAERRVRVAGQLENDAQSAKLMDQHVEKLTHDLARVKVLHAKAHVRLSRLGENLAAMNKTVTITTRASNRKTLESSSRGKGATRHAHEPGHGAMEAATASVPNLRQFRGSFARAEGVRSQIIKTVND